MSHPGILFVCSQFGARSRIAARYAKTILGEEALIEAAGFHPGTFGPLIGRVMREVGLEIEMEAPPSVYAQYTSDKEFGYVVFLCDTAIVDLCELFQMDVNELFTEGEVLVKWAVPPFSDLSGTEQDRLTGAQQIRDGIRGNVEKLLEQIRTGKVEERFEWSCGVPAANAGSDS